MSLVSAFRLGGPKTVLLLFYCVSLVGLFSAMVSGETVILQTADADNLDDGYTAQSYPATEYGSYNQLSVGAPGSGAERQVYIKWSLGTIPPGSIISNASLQLYYSYDGLESDDRLRVGAFYVFPAYGIAGEAWAEGTGTGSGDPCTANELCWSTGPSASQLSSVPEGSVVFDRSTAALSGWYSWAVTQMVQQAASSGEAAMTIALRSSWDGGSLAGSDVVAFRTKEHWYSPFRPRLVIDYETGPVDDVAITSISVPSSVTQGAIVPIGVTVKNEGNQNESFSVSLNDTTDGVLIGNTDAANLSAGSSLTLSFEWDTAAASLRNHTVEAKVSVVPGETDASDNVRDVAVSVTLPDTAAPVISTVEISDITDTRATISWATDEGSDSLVRYGQTLSPQSEASISTFSTSHAVTLNSLSPETTYYFEVQSSDSSENTAIDNNTGLYYSFTTNPAPVVTVPGCQNATFRPAGSYYYSLIFNTEQVGWYSGRDYNHDNAAFATPFPICQRIRITGFMLDILSSPSQNCTIDIGIYSDALDANGNHYPVSLLWSGRVQGNVNGSVEAAMDMWLDPAVYHVVWATAQSTGCPLPPGVHGTPYPPYINTINANGQNELFASYSGAGLWPTWRYLPWSFGSGAYYLKLFYAQYG